METPYTENKESRSLFERPLGYRNTRLYGMRKQATVGSTVVGHCIIIVPLHPRPCQNLNDRRVRQPSSHWKPVLSLVGLGPPPRRTVHRPESTVLYPVRYLNSATRTTDSRGRQQPTFGCRHVNSKQPKRPVRDPVLLYHPHTAPPPWNPIIHCGCLSRFRSPRS